MAAWSGTLHFRHRRLLVHACDLWRPDFPVGATSREAKTYTLVLTGVPCLFDTKSAIDTPALVGRVEGEDLITVDSVRFPAGTALESAWLIVNRSLTPSGSQALNYNKVWQAKGSPVREESRSSRIASGMVDAYVTRLPAIPATLKTYYGL